MMIDAPNIVGLARKSRNNPSAVARSVNAACMAARGITVPMPVFHEGRIVAIVQGYRASEAVDIRWCTINSYADASDAVRAGRTQVMGWTKTATSSGVTNNWYDYWATGGNPSAGTYPGAARVATQWTNLSTGAMFNPDQSPAVKRLVHAEASTTQSASPTLVLYDRVLTYEACTITNANQVMDNTLPALRYIGVGDPGLQLMITVQTVLGATANAYTQLQYTDQDGNALQSAPVAFGVNVIVSAAAPTATLGARVVSPAVAAGTFALGPFMPLAAGDSAVRLIDNYTHSASNTGTLCYVLCRPIAYIPLLNGTTTAIVDTIMQLTNFGLVKDGACLSMLAFVPTTSGATYINRFDLAWG